MLTTLILASRTVGGQVSGGLELATAAFRRFEVGSGVNYRTTADHLLAEHYRLEFQWNQNKADIRPTDRRLSGVKLLHAENVREIVVLDLSHRNLQTLPAKTSRDELAEQAKLAADQYPEAEEMWPCVARR